MSGELKAIETRYKGYRFRSRLEARWAVFFDSLGIEWDFEPQGFIVSGSGYLPDFKLKQAGIFIEIKPQSSIPSDQRLAGFGGNLIVLAGNPWPWEYVAWVPARLMDEHVHTLTAMPSWQFAACDECGFVSLANCGMDGNGAFGGLLLSGEKCKHKNRFFIKPLRAPVEDASRISIAYFAARGARFEHGESGATP